MSVATASDRTQVTGMLGRRAVLAVLLATAVAAAVALRPGALATRLTAGLLPDSNDPFTSDWVRCAAAAVCASGVILLLGWRHFAAHRVALARWVTTAAVLLYLGNGAAWWWYINDDAGITFTYVRNVSAGHGLVYNVGDAPVEGYSNPLWLGLLALLHAVGLAIPLAAKLLGLACGAASLLLLGHLLRGASPLAWLALPLAATSAAFVIWTSSGLENALHALLLLAVVALLARLTGPGVDRYRAAGALSLVLGLLVLSRPEGALFTATSLAFLAWHARRGNRDWRTLLRVGAVPAAVAAGLVLFRLAYFHDVLPNTFYAKAGHTNPLRLLNPLSGGWLYVASGVAGAGWTLVLLPVALLVARRSAWTPLVPAALTVVGSQLFFVVSVGGDWMGEFRFLSVIVPPTCLLIGMALAHLPTLAPARAHRGALTAIIVLAAALVAVTQVPRTVRFAAAPTTSLESVGRVGRYFAELARRSDLPAPTLAHHDAGGTTFLAGLHVIDLGGLCDRTIARHAHDPARIRQYLFHERRPMFIYSGPAFARKLKLETMPELHVDYVPLPPPPSPELDGYLRYVRRDIAPRLVFEPTATLAATP